MCITRLISTAACIIIPFDMSFSLENCILQQYIAISKQCQSAWIDYYIILVNLNASLRVTVFHYIGYIDYIVISVYFQYTYTNTIRIRTVSTRFGMEWTKSTSKKYVYIQKQLHRGYDYLPFILYYTCIWYITCSLSNPAIRAQTVVLCMFPADDRNVHKWQDRSRQPLAAVWHTANSD